MAMLMEPGGGFEYFTVGTANCDFLLYALYFFIWLQKCLQLIEKKFISSGLKLSGYYLKAVNMCSSM